MEPYNITNARKSIDKAIVNLLVLAHDKGTTIKDKESCEVALEGLARADRSIKHMEVM